MYPSKPPEETMKLKLMKFGAKWCSPCIDLAKSKTLEKFAKAHPDVKVEKHDDVAVGTSKAWSDLADEHKVNSIPMLVWMAGGEVLFRSGDVSPEGIERQYKRALRAAGA